VATAARLRGFWQSKSNFRGTRDRGSPPPPGCADFGRTNPISAEHAAEACAAVAVILVGIALLTGYIVSERMGFV
jgi:hypothetical protein